MDKRDHEIVLEMLAEYTNKVRHTLKAHRDANPKMILLILSGALILSLALSATSSLLQPGLAGAISYFSGLGGTLILLIFTFKHVFYLSRLHRNELERLSPRLKRAVEIASQIEDHTNLSIGEKLKFDFYLAEAEAVLEAVQQTIGHLEPTSGQNHSVPRYHLGKPTKETTATLIPPMGNEPLSQEKSNTENIVARTNTLATTPGSS